MFTPVFTDVGGGEFTLGDITVCNANGEEFDDDPAGAGKIDGLQKSLRVQLLTENASRIGFQSAKGYVSAYYKDRASKPNNWGWGTGRTTQIKAGQALIVNNKVGAPIIFKIKSPVAPVAE